MAVSYARFGSVLAIAPAIYSTFMSGCGSLWNVTGLLKCSAY